MRILIYGLNFYPELTGIGKYSGEMAAHLAVQGHEVRVVTAPPYYPYWQVQKPYRAWRYQKEICEQVEVYRCPLWVPQKLSGLKRILHHLSFMVSSFPVVLRQRKWQPDLIMVVAPSFFSVFPSLILHKLLPQTKTWLHIQDFEIDAAFDLGFFSKENLFYRLIQKAESGLLQAFDRVSTISQQMLMRLWEKGVAKEKTYLFPNWINTDLIKPLKQPSAYRREWEIKNEQIVALYAGNMGKKQGLEIILEAAKECTQVSELIFVLCGEGAVRSILEERAKGLPNIRFYPLQPFERLNELLSLADIHLLPQHADAADLVMPSKLSGMLASGKAVIATADPESELGAVIKEVGLLTPPEKVDELFVALKKLVQDSSLRNSLGKKGRAWVLDHWEKETILKEFEKNLKNC